MLIFIIDNHKQYGDALIHINANRLDSIFSQLHNKKILVIGDIMIDEYLKGSVSRLSPEAPVPVIEIESESVRFGGAANVALNLKMLGCIPIIIGITGRDTMADRFFELMEKYNLKSDGIIQDENRPTTVKTRIIGENQHIARVDREQIKYIDGRLVEEVKEKILSHINNTEAIILQDYNKGVLDKEIIKYTISIANEKNKISAVDPKFLNFMEYRDSTVFKPNIKETAQALTCSIQTEDEIKFAGTKLLEKLNVKNVLLTLGFMGMALFESDGTYSHVHTKTRNVADVSGAGDTVISTMTAAMVGGSNTREAASMANYAAGIVCEEVGIVPIEADKLKNEIMIREGHA